MKNIVFADIIAHNNHNKNSDEKSYGLIISSESRWQVRIGERLNLSTFVAVGDELGG
ncbi:MAG: hypothetical protein PHC69_06075 [Ruminiclostridium sp.]|nr:hypothetical protein [Ruminiclostridium sp.]